MSTKNNDANKKMLLSTINEYDTIKDFMEKCNSNFLKISQNGGGPAGVQGEEGSQGAPTKPKVPIHVWKKGKEEDGCQYKNEITTQNGFEINELYEDLSNSIYQNGHLIILENGHVYILKIDETDNFTLKPNYIISLQTYDPSDVTDGENAYVHIAYTNNIIDFDGFETDQDLRREKIESGEFNLIRTLNDIIYSDKPYIGIYTDNIEMSAKEPDRYTWIKVKGDSFTGHPYVIDLEGNMSTISIDIDRTRLYDASDDFCECILHAYYGDKIEKINTSDVEIILPDEYKYLDDNNIVLKSDESNVGTIEKIQSNNDVIIKFIPDENFVFPKKTINFSIHIETTVYDEDDKNLYDFARDVVWMIKGIMSTFELEIVPEYKTIKLFENGEYFPEKLLVDVYKVEDAERTKFDFSQNTDFTLLYKSVNANDWSKYPSDEGIDPKNMSGIEFKVVRYYEKENEEMWDHEDVWVVADGKGTHYYHADLGAAESMMVLTTGEKTNIGTEKDPKYCAELRNESGYSITFDPKFYDGSETLEVTSINFGNINGEKYVKEGTFVRELNGSTLTITKVPYGVEVIPMTIDVTADCPTYDNFGNFVKNISKTDTVSFNVYITTISDLYSLVPTVSSYNTSTGKDGVDKIGCSVYKNTSLIDTGDLDIHALSLYYIVYNETGTKKSEKYSEPLVYGADDDNIKDEFNASDVAIEFILKYRNKEVVKSTVSLIKDGKNGEDGDCWQYIFYRSNKYPFDKTIMSDPSDWSISKDDLSNPDNEYILEGSGWCVDHQGVDEKNKYEYQSYRKWDKNAKKWGKYGTPTLYSNFSENGIGYTVMLSNPVSVIPVGDDGDWKVDENNKNQEDFTLVYLYNNTSDISTDDKVSIKLQNQEDKYVKNGNFSIEKENGINKVVFKPVFNNSTFDFGGNTQYKLPIIITYDLGEGYDKFETTTNWTLTPVRGLEDVEVFVNKQVVNTTKTTKHNLEVGYYLTSSSGNKKIVKSKDSQDNIKKYDIKLTDDIGNINNVTIVQNWANAEYDFKDGNCYVVLVESDGNTIVDYVNVTAVNDGKEGENRVLFYLGSFQDGSLTGQTVKGRLNQYRCDYYIDLDGKAWMRSGTPDENPDGYDGQMDGTKNDTNYWTQSENVDFLKASAIHADMINVNSLVANKAFINDIKAIEISADKIKTGKISSKNENGKSYFDLDTGDFVLGNDNGAALEYKCETGTLTIGGINDILEENITDILDNLGIVESIENIENMEIGGRNILSNTETMEKWTPGRYQNSEITKNNINNFYGKNGTQIISSGGDYKYKVIYGLLDLNKVNFDRQYTLSFNVQAIEHNLCIWCKLSKEKGNDIFYSNEIVIPAGESKRVTFTGYPFKEQVLQLWFGAADCNGIQDSAKEYSVNFYINELKLEYGNKATDWTPSTDEMEAKSLMYLKDALANNTDISGGIVATTQIQLRDWDDTTKKYKVNAGISGIQDDNVLLWGGGSYTDASNAANPESAIDEYKKMDGTEITTLLKKDGTGKIGIFKISETQAVVDVPNQGKVIIDASESNGGIRVLNSSGGINAALLPTSISSFKPLANKTTHSNENNVYYSMGEQTINSEKTAKPIINTISLDQHGEIIPSGETKEELEQYTKKTTISTTSTKFGGNTVFFEGNIRTTNHSMFVQITCDLLYNGNVIESKFDKIEVHGGNYNNIVLDNKYNQFKISFSNTITKQITVSNSKNVQLKITVELTDKSDSEAYIDRVNLRVKMESIYMFYKATTTETYTYHPQTIIGTDGLISLVSNNKYFMVDNSGNTQKIFAKGLGTSQGDPGSGELYVTNDFINAFKSFVTKAKDLFSSAKYRGTGDAEIRKDANAECDAILTSLNTTSIIANS